MRERTIDGINQRLEMHHLFLQVAGKIRKDRGADADGFSLYLEGKELTPARTKRRLLN